MDITMKYSEIVKYLYLLETFRHDFDCINYIKQEVLMTTFQITQ